MSLLVMLLPENKTEWISQCTRNKVNHLFSDTNLQKRPCADSNKMINPQSIQVRGYGWSGNWSIWWKYPLLMDDCLVDSISPNFVGGPLSLFRPNFCLCSAWHLFCNDLSKLTIVEFFDSTEIGLTSDRSSRSILISTISSSSSVCTSSSSWAFLTSSKMIFCLITKKLNGLSNMKCMARYNMLEGMDHPIDLLVCSEDYGTMVAIVFL
jgi:hypothetical protein